VTLALPPENLTAKPQCVNTQKISAKFPKADIPDFALSFNFPANNKHTAFGVYADGEICAY